MSTNTESTMPSIKIDIQDQSKSDRSEATMYSVTMITTLPLAAVNNETNSTNLVAPELNTPRPSIASTIMASYENDRYTAIIREIIRSDSLISGERSASNSFNSNRSTRSNLTPTGPTITNELSATGHSNYLHNLEADYENQGDDVEKAQAMQTLLAMQNINDARQSGTSCLPNKVRHDRRYYWNKVRDHSDRAKRYVKLVITLHQSCVVYIAVRYMFIYFVVYD